jgi:hypothetical protein
MGSTCASKKIIPFVKIPFFHSLSNNSIASENDSPHHKIVGAIQNLKSNAFILEVKRQESIKELQQGASNENTKSTIHYSRPTIIHKSKDNLDTPEYWIQNPKINHKPNSQVSIHYQLTQNKKAHSNSENKELNCALDNHTIKDSKNAPISEENEEKSSIRSSPLAGTKLARIKITSAKRKLIPIMKKPPQGMNKNVCIDQLDFSKIDSFPKMPNSYSNEFQELCFPDFECSPIKKQ